jgi:predicted small lipoprotein YifL
MSRIAALMIVLSLTACGMKGSLVLPPGPAPEPLLGSGKTTAPDVSTPSNSKNQ